MDDNPTAAEFWDNRYRDREAFPEKGRAPFLMESVPFLPRHSRVLDVAVGPGRNALYLASLGFDVVGIDISRVALERCQETARRDGLRLQTILADLETFPLPERAFDAVLNFYFLQRDLCPALAAALRPGGVLVFQSYTTEQRRYPWGPTRDEHLLKPGELRALFSGLEVLVYREEIEMGERGEKAVASLIARRV